MNQQVKVFYETTINDFLAVLSGVKTEDFNVVPFKESWTAGELSQHIVLSAGGFSQLLNGPVKETAGAPDAKIAAIKDIFLNFNTKLKSPDFIVPEIKDYDKISQMEALKGIREETLKAISENDLTKTCTAMELPSMGNLTGLEAVYFVVYHTQRHTHQLKNIAAELSKK